MQQQEQQHPTLSELLEHAQMDKTEYQQLKTLIKVLDLLSSWKPLPITTQSQYLPQLYQFVCEQITSEEQKQSQIAFSRLVLSLKPKIEQKVLSLIQQEIQRDYMTSLVMDYLEKKFQISCIENDEVAFILDKVIGSCIDVSGEQAGQMTNLDIEEYVKSKRKAMRAAFAEARQAWIDGDD